MLKENYYRKIFYGTSLSTAIIFRCVMLIPTKSWIHLYCWFFIRRLEKVVVDNTNDGNTCFTISRRFFDTDLIHNRSLLTKDIIQKFFHPAILSCTELIAVRSMLPALQPYNS